MGLETPLALLALAAVGVPILAHLLRRRDLPTRQLPTVALLQRAEAQSQRNVRLVDRLLLLARILLVAALVIALAAPFVRIALAYGDGSAASVALVIDDSLSVTGRGLSASMRERALAILGSLPDGSEITVVLAGEEPRVAAARTTDRASAERALSEIDDDGARGTDLSGAIERAAHELAGARHARRRVVVLSDMAVHARPRDVTLPPGVGVEFETVGADAPTGNAAIVSARATPDPTTPGIASVAIEIAVAEELAGRDAAVTIESGGAVVANGTVQLTAPGSRALLHAPLQVDDPAATVSLDVDDAVELDDHRGVLLRRGRGISTLVVDGAPQSIHEGGGACFLGHALDLAPATGGLIERRTVDPDTFATLELDGVDVIVLVDAPAPTGELAARIDRFVQDGGGLLIAPGDHFEPRAWIARLGAALPARPSAPHAMELGGPLPSAVSDLAAGHSGLEGARTRRRIDFEEPASDATVELVFDDGSAALLEHPHGAGRVALLATTLDDGWTDLPLQPGFLPLMASTVRRLSGAPGAMDEPLDAGRPAVLPLPAGTRAIAVSGPTGVVFEASGEELDRRAVVTDTARPGIYTVELATADHGLRAEPRLTFVVAPPAAESDLTPAEAPESTDEGDASSVHGTTMHRSLTPWVFFLAGLLAVAEAALRLRPRRFAR
ncbi:MAG: VWA domain-containing protein [Sandaracinaceae bacterium]